MDSRTSIFKRKEKGKKEKESFLALAGIGVFVNVFAVYFYTNND